MLCIVGCEANSKEVTCSFTSGADTNYHINSGSCLTASSSGGQMGAYALANCVGHTCGALPSDTTAPSIPSDLIATTVSGSQINLSWTASTDNVGVSGYRVERCQGAGCANFAQIATPTGTSHNNTGLIASTIYRYRVRAADAAGNLSGYSSIASATTPAGGVVGDLNSDGSVTLADLRLQIQMLTGSLPPDMAKADLDGNGQLTLADVRALINILVAP
jgi:hypothetical protein